MISDIGAMLSGRWHDSHFAWKIGAMSLVNVGVAGAAAAIVEAGTCTIAPIPNTPAPAARHIHVLNVTDIARSFPAFSCSYDGPHEGCRGA